MTRPEPSERRGQLYVEPRMPPSWEAATMALTVGSLVVVGIDAFVDGLSRDTRSLLQWLDTGACAVFLADFVARARRAPRRIEFLRRNWVDLLGAIPMFDALRAWRLFRLVRLLRLTRLSMLWRLVARRFELPVPKGLLGNISLLTLVAWIGSAAGFYHFEQGSNDNLRNYADALWWSMTTLSTVGYGDLYPTTGGGRIIAAITMICGIGLLGAVAATVASAFVDFRERGRRGLRSYAMRDHLLVLGWNDKASQAIRNFRRDARHTATDVVVVADLEESPLDDARVRFVRGSPGRSSALERASAGAAGAAIVLSRDPADPRSDHECALVVSSLRRINPAARIAVELVDSENDEFLRHAGCDAVIDKATTIANLLVRSVQDIGVSDVITELLDSAVGTEMYRVAVDEDFVGKTYREYVLHMLDSGSSVVGIARKHERLLAPEGALRINEGDDAFVVAREPPL